jgi:16S rRNA (uracil1498-N3)-methyltransferase
MNSLILYQTDQLDELNFQVTDSDRLEHLSRVLKVTKGKELTVTFLNHGIGEAVVTYADSKKVDLTIKKLNQTLAPKIKLYIAVSRPPTIKKLLEHGTSLGVSEFIFYKAALSEKSYLDSKVFEENSINKLLDLGLSQSAYYYQRPVVKVLPYLPEQELMKNPSPFYLDPSANHFLNKEIVELAGEEKAFIIGPERGFTNEELKIFENLGLKGIKLHRSILRVEIATFALLGQLEQALG